MESATGWHDRMAFVTDLPLGTARSLRRAHHRMTSRQRCLLLRALLGSIVCVAACAREATETDPRRRAYTALHQGECGELQRLAADRTLPDSLAAMFEPLPELCLASSAGVRATSLGFTAMGAAEVLIRIRQYGTAFVRLTGDSTTVDSLPRWLEVQRDEAIGWIRQAGAEYVLDEIRRSACRGESTALAVFLPPLSPGGPVPHVLACSEGREGDVPVELRASQFQEPLVVLHDSIVSSTAWYTCGYSGGPPAVAMRGTHRLWLVDLQTGAVVAETSIRDVREVCPFQLRVETTRISAGFNIVEFERWLRREAARLAREGVADSLGAAGRPGRGRTIPRS